MWRQQHCLTRKHLISYWNLPKECLVGVRKLSLHQKSNDSASYIMPAWSISSSFKVLMCLYDLLIEGEACLLTLIAFSLCVLWTVTSQLFAPSGILIYFWWLLPLKFISFHQILLVRLSRHWQQNQHHDLSKQLVFLCFLKVIEFQVFHEKCYS